MMMMMMMMMIINILSEDGFYKVYKLSKRIRKNPK